MSVAMETGSPTPPHPQHVAMGMVQSAPPPTPAASTPVAIETTPPLPWQQTNTTTTRRYRGNSPATPSVTMATALPTSPQVCVPPSRVLP